MRIEQPISGNPQLIAFAEKLLDEVKTGKVSSLACVTVSPIGMINCPALGMQVTEIYLGCGLLQNNIISMAGKASPIVRA